jgi:hypothetical protein
MLWVMGFRKERMKKKEKKNCGFKGRGNNYLKKLWEFFYMVELIL